MANRMGRDYVPTADTANNVVMSDVVGNKTDTIAGDSLVAQNKVLTARSEPIITTDTFSYLDAGGVQVVKALTITKVTEVYFWLDLSTMTQDGTVLVQSKVDGTNYRTVYGAPFTAAQADGAFVGPMMVNTDVQVAYVESVDEGAARAIVYRTIQITKED
jgi:hypothetical protein